MYLFVKLHSIEIMNSEEKQGSIIAVNNKTEST